MDNHLEDVKKYDKHPNIDVLNKITHNLQLIMHEADARYVSATDPKELELVVNHFAVKKLGVSKEEGEKAVQEVAHMMKEQRMKNRIVFYYLVAKVLNKFDKIV